MRDKSLDEFASIFERASIPVLDIREIPLPRISAVLKGDPLDETILTLAGYLRKRFNAAIHVYWPATLAEAPALETVRGWQMTVADRPFNSTAELVGQVSINNSGLFLSTSSSSFSKARRMRLRFSSSSRF